jgi:hypothetical protein
MVHLQRSEWMHEWRWLVTSLEGVASIGKKLVIPYCSFIFNLPPLASDSKLCLLSVTRLHHVLSIWLSDLVVGERWFLNGCPFPLSFRLLFSLFVGVWATSRVLISPWYRALCPLPGFRLDLALVVSFMLLLRNLDSTLLIAFLIVSYWRSFEEG